MSRATYFVQECPTCGRRLQVRVEYLGKVVLCQHCRARFEAQDPAGIPRSQPTPGAELLDRVEQLLESADRVRMRPE